MSKEPLIAKSIEELEKKAGVDISPNIDPKITVRYIKSAGQVFSSAESEFVKGNHEKAYMYYFKYCNVFSQIRTTSGYRNDQKAVMDEFKAVFFFDRVDAVIKKLEKLKTKLTKTYAEIEKKEEEKRLIEMLRKKEEEEKQRELEEMERLRIEADRPPVDAFALFSSGQVPLIPDGCSAKDIVPKEPNISAVELKGMIDAKLKTLMVDVRSLEEFKDSHMMASDVILVNSNYLEINTRLTASELQELIIIKSQKELWAARGDYDLIVVFDTASSYEETRKSASHPVNIVREGAVDCLTSTSADLPKILDGGYQSWVAHYPRECTNPERAKKKTVSKANTRRSAPASLVSLAPLPPDSEPIYPALSRDMESRAAVLHKPPEEEEKGDVRSVQINMPVQTIQINQFGGGTVIGEAATTIKEKVVDPIYAEVERRPLCKEIHPQLRPTEPTTQYVDISTFKPQVDRTSKPVLAVRAPPEDPAVLRPSAAASQPVLQRPLKPSRTIISPPLPPVQQPSQRPQSRPAPTAVIPPKPAATSQQLVSQPAEQRPTPPKPTTSPRAPAAVAVPIPTAAPTSNPPTVAVQRPTVVPTPAAVAVQRPTVAPTPAAVAVQRPTVAPTPPTVAIQRPTVAPTPAARPAVNRTVKPLSRREFEEKRLRANPSYGSVQLGACGLKNIGNTCFMNAVLQCLSATAPLSRYFLSGAYKDEVNPSNPLGTQGLVAKEYAFLVECMWGNEIRHFSPKDWKVAIGRFRPQFLDFTQKDSQEFTSFMLDALHEDLNRVLEKPRQQEEIDYNKLDYHAGGERAWQQYKARNNSVIVDLFQGQFRGRTQCVRCNFTSTTYDTFMYLTVPIPGRGTVDLRACIESFTQPEEIEWRCEKCKVMGKARKELTVWRLPTILVVILKRFSYSGVWRDKISTMVRFPLDDFLAEGHKEGWVSNERERKRYRLFGVTNHTGTLEGGHYIGCARNPVSGDWFTYDDHVIRPMRAAQTQKKEAYLLFYTSLSEQEDRAALR